MIRNYFTVAWRNIRKHGFFSVINIMGMAIGVTACLLIVLYVADEVSFDRFHSHANRIYQVNLHGKIAGQDIKTANTCPPLSRTMVDEIPEVEAATRLAPYYGNPIVKHEETSFTEEKVFFADSNFFEFFTFELLQGDPSSALLEPNSIVLTESMAKKYFGDEDPMGKMVTLANESPERTFKVTAVTRDCPSNSHFIYNILMSSSSADYLQSDVWLNNFLYTYCRLGEQADVGDVESKFPYFVEKYVGPEMERFIGVSFKDMEKQGGAYGFFTTALTDIHLRSTTRDSIEPSGNEKNVYSFAAIALLILVIACINFMNLSTARSAGRAKEVGLRKTLGSFRSQLVGQFMAESLIYSFLSVILAIAATVALLPYFNLLAGKSLGIEVLASPAFIAGIGALVVFVTMIAGSYPAFYLTSFNAVEVLKGKVRAGMKSKGIRSGLVVFQFMVSMLLIIFTVVIFQQLRFMETRDMGIDKHNVIILKNTNRLGDQRESFKNLLMERTGIVGASYTNNSFPGVNSTTVFKDATSEQDHIMGVYFADHDHQNVMRFDISEGRFFSRDYPSDSMAIVLNEAAVREFGLSDPIGHQILYNDDPEKGPYSLTVVGVVRDFNFETLKENVRPLAIRQAATANQIMIRYEGSPSDAIEGVKTEWKKLAADLPFEYVFLDENFDELFRSEQRMGRIFTAFSILAIFVACLGLFALAAFTAEQRTKEIGIRKVMGASVPALAMLLSREFTVLVVVAFVPSAFLGWWLVNSWLSEFAYRIPLNPLVFVFSGALAMVIAWLTVGFQAVRTAASNPVNSLRYE